MTNCSRRDVFDTRHSVIPSTFDFRLPRRSPAKAGASSLRARGAFTILELLVVISIIIVLAGLILATVGYVQKKGARSRAEAEIAAMSAALESYRADNGIYPTATSLDPITNLDAAKTDKATYETASRALYGELSGDRNFDGTVTDTDKINPTDALPKTYFSFRPQMLQRANMSLDVNSGNPVQALRDPFGNSYGYSTAHQNDPTKGYNPTFDLWCTASSTNQNEWIKNW